MVQALQSLFDAAPPDAWLCSKLLWFDSGLRPSTVLARGAALHLPDLRGAGEAVQTEVYEALGNFLCQLEPDEAVQFQWRLESDYQAELEIYRRRGEEAGATGWCAHVRRERFERYRALQQQGLLRRECLELFLSKRCSQVPKQGFSSAAQVDQFLEQASQRFAERFKQLEGQVPGARLRAFEDGDHYATWRAFLQPSLRPLGAERFQGFDASRPLLENVWPGGGITTRDAEGHVFFLLDGQYQALLVLRRWPMETFFGIIWSLTGILSSNYAYTLTCLPLDGTREVQRTEDEMRRLRGSRRTEQKESLDEVLARKKARISALQGGFAKPFAVLPVLRVWDSSLPALVSRVQALKQALGAMGGAQAYQVDHPVQAKRLFFETLPGWTGGRYRDWDLFALAGRDASVCFLQDLLPLSCSFHGHLEDGEALYDGEQGNLVGLRSFAQDTPQHSVMIGTTRVGKSSQVIDYLSQSDCFFGFRGIVEEGLSYGTLVQLLGGESIVLHPDGDLTFNYFDTGGAPLTRLQVASAAGLLLLMSGKGRDSEANQHRKAMLAEYLDQLYTDAWTDARLRDPALESQAAREALALERSRLRTEGERRESSLLELYSDLREALKRKEGPWLEVLGAVSEDEALAFARGAGATLVRDVGLASLPSALFPTHTTLLEALRYNRLPHHAKELVDRLASQLAPWQRGGPHGRLFDGVSNRSLEARLVHFELGLLPSSNSEMKEAAVYLIASRLRQRLVTLPRALRKQFIFEEPSRYLQVGGMEELFAEFYAQMGKFGCQILPVTQQYGQLARSALRPVIFGNSKQFFLFKQNDRHDLDEIGEAIGLPEPARAAIRGFSAPEYQARGERFSQMALFAVEGGTHVCGSLRNKVSREMLFVSQSSGEVFDQRSKLLASYADPVEGVCAEAARTVPKTASKGKPPTGGTS